MFVKYIITFKTCYLSITKKHIFIAVSSSEISSLLDIFNKFSSISGPKNRLERVKFRDELHKSFQITDDFLMDRSKIL